jgi:hypothetical protein
LLERLISLSSNFQHKIWDKLLNSLLDSLLGSLLGKVGNKIEPVFVDDKITQYIVNKVGELLDGL